MSTTEGRQGADAGLGAEKGANSECLSAPQLGEEDEETPNHHSYEQLCLFPPFLEVGWEKIK